MDIGEKLQELLASPDGMQKLQSAAGQLQNILGEDGDAADLLAKLAGGQNYLRGLLSPIWSSYL